MDYNIKPITREGDIDIFSQDHFYWHTNLSLNKIRTLHSLLGEYDFLEALKQAGIPSNYVADYQRSDIIYFLPYQPDNDFKVLDLGSGFGNITLPLAQKMSSAQIWAVDASLDILKILEARAKRDSLTNIKYAKVDVFEHCNLPFAPQSFDVIVMNGVLEWIGAGVETGNPRDLQVNFLRYIKTLLKPNGYIYVGIEGRLFPGYLMNIRDPHSGLLYTSVLPRFLAHHLARFMGKPQGYRTYTYTLRGYLKLFREAGFKGTVQNTVYPVASYKDPFYLFGYQDRKAYQLAFKGLSRKVFPTPRGRILYQVLYWLGLEKIFAPSYLFIQGISGQDASQARLLSHIIGSYDKSLLVKYEPIKVQGNLSDAAAAIFWLLSKSSGQPEWVVKIQRYFASTLSQEKIQWLVEKNWPECILPVYANSQMSIYPFQPGQGLKSWTDLIEASIVIANIHRRAQKVPNYLGDILLNRGFIHGDYTLENIIRDNSGELHIIDFDDYDQEQYQIFDLCSLILHYFQVLSKNNADDVWAKRLINSEILGVMQVSHPHLRLQDLQDIWVAFLRFRINQSKNAPSSRTQRYQAVLNSLLHN